MTFYGSYPSLKRTTEPVDVSVWHWFVCNGPHGERFCWHREVPHQKRDIELLREFMDERKAANPGFLNNARLIALEALGETSPILLLTAIQVLTVVGTAEDFMLVTTLASHPDERVAKNARCALFERGIKLNKHERHK